MTRKAMPSLAASEPASIMFGEPSGPPGGPEVKGIYTLDLPFHTSIDMPAQEMQSLQLRFCPRDSLCYEATIPIYLNGDTSKPYLIMEVTGQGQHPRLSFDVRECILPPVPLGMHTQATFHIINNGYDNLELQYKLPADDSHVPMEVSFPEGTLIGIAKDKLPVVVTFSSSKPLSFTANIDFMDEDGKRYSLPVTGTTDNCLLTNQAFIAANASGLILTAPEGAPVMLEEAVYTLPSAGASLGPLGYSRAMALYLNATTTRGPFDDVAKMLAGSRGKLLIDLLEMLSGKSVPGKVGLYAFVLICKCVVALCCVVEVSACGVCSCRFGFMLCTHSECG